MAIGHAVPMKEINWLILSSSKKCLYYSDIFEENVTAAHYCLVQSHKQSYKGLPVIESVGACGLGYPR